MAPCLDESPSTTRRPCAALDSRDDAARRWPRPGAQVRRALTSPPRPASSGWPAVSGPARCSWRPWAARRSSATCSTLLAEPGSPVPVTIRRNAAAARLGRPARPRRRRLAVRPRRRARSPWRPRPPAAAPSLLTVGRRRLAAGRRLRPGPRCARRRGRGRRPSSRTALWSLLTPVLLAADALGLVECPAAGARRVADRLDEHAEACRPAREAFVNPAKILALELADTVPVVLGDGPLTGVAAARAASMLARTARVPATYGALPDAASQVVACFDGPFDSPAGPRAGERRGERDIFADPFLDGPPTPRLGLLMLRDAPTDPVTPRSADQQASPTPSSRPPATPASGSRALAPGPGTRSSGWPDTSRSPTSPRPTSRSGSASTPRCPRTSPSCATAPAADPAPSGRGGQGAAYAVGRGRPLAAMTWRSRSG